MAEIDPNLNQQTAPEASRAPTIGDQIEELESSYPWGIIAFLGAWAFLLLTYWL